MSSALVVLRAVMGVFAALAVVTGRTDSGVLAGGPARRPGYPDPGMARPAAAREVHQISIRLAAGPTRKSA